MNPFEQSQAELAAMPDSLRVDFEAILAGHGLTRELFEKGALETMYTALTGIGHNNLVKRLRVYYSSK